MDNLSLDIQTESLRLTKPFRISGHVWDTSEVVVVTLSDGHYRGRGEAAGVYYLGDTVPVMVEAIEGVRGLLDADFGREALQALLPPGGARNALDCALWELEAQRSGKPVWKLAGQDAPKPLRTTFTLGADDPKVMAQGARDYSHALSIKVKLTGDLDLDIARVRAIRAARPDAWLGVDGNQGFKAHELDPLTAALKEANVSLLEQPLARGCEADLDGYQSPIPIAGDESILSLADVASAKGRFDMINIKLDKCGGLTEGLMMAAEARRLGLGVMVGNMGGTSLATAPGFVLGQLCDLVDLDGPTFLSQDRKPGVVYAEGNVWAGPEVWGSGTATPA